MRMFAQDAAFYRRVRVDETDDPEALRRLKQLEAIDRMRERFTVAEALSAPELGRSTYYERKRRLREEGREGAGSAQQPPEEPLRAAVDEGGREAGAGGASGEAVGGEGDPRARRGRAVAGARAMRLGGSVRRWASSAVGKFR